MDNLSEVPFSLVTGKNVALVGPAKYMKGSNFGKEIDANDTVVRINRGIESTLVYPDDLGVRTDIYYSCLIERAQQTGKLNPEELLKKYGIKCVIAPPHSNMKGIATGDFLHELVDEENVKKISEIIPLFVIDHRFHTNLARAVDCKPNTGFLAIYDLINSKPKKLSIYGFSFYLDGFIPGQKSGVENEKNCTEDEFANLAFTSKRHVQKNMWNFAKNTLFDRPNGVEVVTDPILTKILNLPDLDREIFNKTC